jgi:phospholipase C
MSLRSTLAGRRLLMPAITFTAFLCALLSGCWDDSNTVTSPASTVSTPTTTTTPTPPTPSTPIQHVVVIFQENVSFDHYFGTYPKASNPPGEPKFTAAAGTPVVNSLATPLDPTNNFAALAGASLLTANPTAANALNGSGAVNPFRLDRTQIAQADQSHDYDTEQKGFDNKKMDLFPLSVGAANSVAPQPLTPPLNTTGLTMGYFDGNTVTAYWNYAQNFAMNDNSFGTTFGPSAPGAINLISGQTNGIIATNQSATVNISGDSTSDGNGGATLNGDSQPLNDACMTRDAVMLSGKNIGDLLNAAGVSWGFFQGGFDLTVVNSNGTTGCNRTTTSGYTSVTKTDFIAHHQPFQYYKTTQNLTHARPSSISAIGNTYEADGKTLDPANHQYDIHDFFDAVAAGNFPAVSFLKAPGYQDGHAQYSDPLDEQEFVTTVINFLQKQPGWSSTLVIIAYDDSDGFYDHQMSPIVNPSMLTVAGANYTSNGMTVTGIADWLNGAGVCNAGVQQGTATPATALAGANGTANAQGRCGYGPRLPFLVISPYAKKNFVDHTLIDQSSIIRFIEDNWLSSARIGNGSFDAIAGTITNMLSLTGTGAGTTPALYLDTSTGLPLDCPTCQ